MFEKHSRSSQHASFAASAALFVMTTVLTSPTLAAISTQLDCPDAEKATLDVPHGQLVTQPVSHNVSASSIDAKNKIAELERLETASADSLLVPRAEAAIRSAFSASKQSSPVAGTDSKPDAANGDDDDVKIDAGMNTRLPGISDEDFARYKKRMYRRDI